MLKTLFTHLMFYKDDVLLLDMYAGVEHLGRASVDFAEAMSVVVEPTRRSLGTTAQIKKPANDIGLTRLYLVGTKLRLPLGDRSLVHRMLSNLAGGWSWFRNESKKPPRSNTVISDEVQQLKDQAGCGSASSSMMR